MGIAAMLLKYSSEHGNPAISFLLLKQNGGQERSTSKRRNNFKLTEQEADL
jgi:hypothetical protein